MRIFWFALLAVALIGGLVAWLKRRRKSARRTWRERFSGLQWRMTFSYVWITTASILVFALLVSPLRLLIVPLALVIGLIFWLRNRRISSYPRGSTLSTVWIIIISLLLLVVLFSSLDAFFNPTTPGGQTSTPADAIGTVKQVAQQYASSIEQQAEGNALGATFPYPLGQALDVSPDSYTDRDAKSLLSGGHVPYLPKLYPANQPVTFALLIAPDQHILSSSYPARYPLGEQATALLPTQIQWIEQALHGNEHGGAFADANGTMVYATASVLNKHKQSVGALYVQVPLTTLSSTAPTVANSWQNYLLSYLLIALILFIVLAPLGGIFGFISTRGLVSRLKVLASATTLVADGDYQQRLLVASKDEVGQLEHQFNRMAEQLGESTARQKALAEENARLAERSRISRELHDAISQDLFSLSLLAGGLQSALPADSPLQRQAGILEQTTNDTIREMRALLLELRPTRLEQLNLTEALAELAAAYRTRLGIRVTTNLANICLEARREHALLRIAQEALANAARHASATEITITLAQKGQNACLRLRDNGRGFQAGAESLRHGLGLRMMQERVQELSGTLTLESAPEQGTTLTFCLPLEEVL
jgi:signal transduction histidine kinase